MNKKITVLIADDNSEFSATLAGYINAEEDLELVGMARDGVDAFDMIKNLEPDIVLLDVIMPRLDGLGVLERLEENNIEKMPMCIMLSAVGQDKITQKAINLGAQYYIVKPFEISVLIKRINELKFFQPVQSKIPYTSREIKTSYIEIAPNEKKNEENLEALVTNMIHEIGVPAHIKGYQYLREDKKVLFEGAQGAMLDIDYGTYPFVTSSHPGANGVSEGAGIGPLYIKEAIGIIKAYTTRVGSGPFPTELNDATGDLIRERGHEYGTVTERPRRTGWFDAVVVNQSRRMSSLTGISLMLLDVMSGFDTIKICKAYKLDGKEIYGLPATVKDIERCEPVYEELPGWKEDITHVKSFEELPVNCQNYIRKIEELVHCPVRMFSVGPDREQTVVLKDIKF